MTRLAMISALLILGLAATGAAMIATQEREPAQTRSAAPSKTAAQEREPTKPAVPEKKVEILSVRVIDTKGRGVPDVEIKVVEEIPHPRTMGRDIAALPIVPAPTAGSASPSTAGFRPAHLRIATRRSDDRLGKPTIGPVVAEAPRTTIPSR